MKITFSEFSTPSALTKSAGTLIITVGEKAALSPIGKALDKATKAPSPPASRRIVFPEKQVSFSPSSRRTA